MRCRMRRGGERRTKRDDGGNGGGAHSCEDVCRRASLAVQRVACQPNKTTKPLGHVVVDRAARRPASFSLRHPSLSFLGAFFIRLFRQTCARCRSLVLALWLSVPVPFNLLFNSANPSIQLQLIEHHREQSASYCFPF